MSRVVIVVQARMGSERLPGKVLKGVLPGKTVISALLDRLCLSKQASHLLVAIPDTAQDDELSKHIEKTGVKVFRGDEHDVLSRFLGAAQNSNADVIVRISADSPMLDVAIVDTGIQKYLSHQHDCELVTNMMPETFPYGMAVEIISIDTLKRIDRLATSKSDREHVTAYIYRHPTEFRVLNFAADSKLSHLRVVVDYPEDLAFVQKVYAELHSKDPVFSLQSIVDLLQAKPEILQINASRNDRLKDRLANATNLE